MENAEGGAVSFLDPNPSGAGAGAGAGAGGGAGGSSGGGGSAMLHTDPNAAGGFARPGLDKGYDWETEARRAMRFDDDAFKDSLVNAQYNERNRLRDEARSKQQQLGNYAYYDWNLGKNNPRGNLNGLSYETTLRMQRLADMVNNRIHYDPGTAATIGGADGAKGVGQGIATVGQWDPMESQEMRQMRANERVDERARNAGVDLQSRIQAYPQEIQEKGDENVMKMRYYISQMDDDFMSFAQKAVMDREYGGSWENYFEELFKQYSTDLDLNTKDRVFKYLYRMASVMQTIAGRVFVGGGYIAPNELQLYANQALNAILNSIPDDFTRFQVASAFNLMMAPLFNQFQAVQYNQAYGHYAPPGIGAIHPSAPQISGAGGGTERTPYMERVDQARYGSR